MFKKPELAYSEYIRLEKEKLQQEQKRISDAQDIEFAKQFLRSFFRNLGVLFLLSEYTDNNFIPLSNCIYGKWELARIRYGKWTADWLKNKIYEALAEIDDPCISNVTFCQVGNNKEEDDYYNTRDCCGRREFIKTYWLTGKTYRYGFNYGH